LEGRDSESPTLSLRAGRSSPTTMEVGLVELVPPTRMEVGLVELVPPTRMEVGLVELVPPTTMEMGLVELVLQYDCTALRRPFPVSQTPQPLFKQTVTNGNQDLTEHPLSSRRDVAESAGELRASPWNLIFGIYLDFGIWILEFVLPLHRERHVVVRARIVIRPLQSAIIHAIGADAVDDVASRQAFEAQGLVVEWVAWKRGQILRDQ
jgi:hypothetical protein